MSQTGRLSAYRGAAVREIATGRESGVSQLGQAVSSVVTGITAQVNRGGVRRGQREGRKLILLTGYSRSER